MILWKKSLLQSFVVFSPVLTNEHTICYLWLTWQILELLVDAFLFYDDKGLSKSHYYGLRLPIKKMMKWPFQTLAIIIAIEWSQACDNCGSVTKWVNTWRKAKTKWSNYFGNDHISFAPYHHSWFFWWPEYFSGTSDRFLQLKHFSNFWLTIRQSRKLLKYRS